MCMQEPETPTYVHASAEYLKGYELRQASASMGWPAIPHRPSLPSAYYVGYMRICVLCTTIDFFR